MVTQIHKFKSKKDKWPPHNLVWDKKRVYSHRGLFFNYFLRGVEVLIIKEEGFFSFLYHNVRNIEIQQRCCHGRY